MPFLNSLPGYPFDAFLRRWHSWQKKLYVLTPE